MKRLQVRAAPEKPLLIFDGDCGFCRFWVRRWQSYTSDSIEYFPFQDPSIAARFPELQRDLMAAAVHLVETDGSVSIGAEAAFRVLARHAQHEWLLDWYEHSAAFRRGSEWIYRLVARHRQIASWLTRLGWGDVAEPSTYAVIRSVFLRGLGAVYLCAFLSLWVQIEGLVGGNGVLPAQVTVQLLKQ